jgi:hypothetical protein
MSDYTYVMVKPDCDVHKFEKNTPGVEASYDARTHTGQWANVCDECFETHTPGVLGTGRAQKLVVGEKPKKDVTADVEAALMAGDWDAMEEAIGDGDLADYL